MRASGAWALLLLSFCVFEGAAISAEAAEYSDPEGAETIAAAEAAVAKLGAQRARTVSGPTRALSGQVRSISGLAQGVQARVQSLESAKRDLGAQESELEIHIDLPADVLFDVDKADIREDAAQALAHLATVIRAYQGTVRLLGHTDADGSEAHNLTLSKRRAESVRQWLAGRASINASRLRTEGHGETMPVAPNDTAENKQRNRRVEVIIRKR